MADLDETRSNVHDSLRRDSPPGASVMITAITDSGFFFFMFLGLATVFLV